MDQGCLGAVVSGDLKIHRLVHTDGLVRGCGREGFPGKREAGREWVWGCGPPWSGNGLQFASGRQACFGGVPGTSSGPDTQVVTVLAEWVRRV